MARKKNAPAIKSNLRDVPADKFRAVNRMNGIVTMVEYTSEDDIKAYEMEPTFRELGGGGGVDINNPTLTINYHQNGYTEPVVFGSVFNLQESGGYIALIDGYLTTDRILLDGEDGQIKLYMTTNDVELSFKSSITNITGTDEINCELLNEGIYSEIAVENSQENASISISYTLTGLG